MHNPAPSRHIPPANREPISSHPHLQFPFPPHLLYHNDMNNIQALMPPQVHIIIRFPDPLHAAFI